ncbi:MAG: trypsin-like peptidase domain-containing protein [Proteobacteria bacterium]|nr:trypsin-like peptidase domain-containing protein [Pseudomonadota bacterium]
MDPEIDFNEKPSLPRDLSSIKVKATGFLLSPRVVITAQHVITGLRAKGIGWDDLTLGFLSPNIGSPGPADLFFQKGALVHSVGVTLGDGTQIVPPRKTPMSDIALLRLSRPVEFPKSSSPQGLKVADPSRILVGESVVVPGYYLGQTMLRPHGDASRRFGPLFLWGSVASIAPHGIRGHKLVSDYYVDVTCGGGLSGSPVCTTEGEVIGILTGGIETELDKVPDQKISRNLGRVLPLIPEVADQFVKVAMSDVATEWPAWIPLPQSIEE